MALLFVGLQLLLLGVFVVLQCCPLYAGAPLQASLRSQRHAQEFLHQVGNKALRLITSFHCVLPVAHTHTCMHAKHA